MRKVIPIFLISLLIGTGLQSYGGSNCPSRSNTPCKGKCLFRRELEFLGGSTDPDDMIDWLTHLDVGCYELDPDGDETDRTTYGLFADSFGATVTAAVLYISSPIMGEIFNWDIVDGQIKESTGDSGAREEEEEDVDDNTWDSIVTTANGYSAGTPHDYSLINYRCWEFAEDEYASLRFPPFSDHRTAYLR